MKFIIAKRVDAFLCNNFPRYKLWRICNAIGITPHPWQRDFALGKSNNFGTHAYHRATGKTMAVMLRILMRTDIEIRTYMFEDDPDWIPYEHVRVRWYLGEYRKLANKCLQSGIAVPKISSYNRMAQR